MDLLSALEGGLIVSVQAPSPSDPMCHPTVMARVAQAAVSAGAVAIRCGGVGGVDHIRAIRSAVGCPIIGLTKRTVDDRWITPTPGDVGPIAAAGADIVAFDAVVRRREDVARVREMASAIHAEGRLAMADIARMEDARPALDAGADLLATTMAGYVAGSLDQTGDPDLPLVRALVDAGCEPVIAEGRYHSPDLARAAIDAGAFAVVVGSAITSPSWLTERFARALGQGQDRTEPRPRS